MILGASFQTASTKETPFLMAQLIDNLAYHLEIAESDTDKLFAILDAHIRFEPIHPFSGGNGRTGRMLLIYSLLEQGLQLYARLSCHIHVIHILFYFSHFNYNFAPLLRSFNNQQANILYPYYINIKEYHHNPLLHFHHSD